MMTPALAPSTSPLFLRIQNAALSVIAAAHLIALVSFLLIVASISVARADDARACKGENLLDELKSEKPQEYQQIIAEGDKILNGKAIFWRIQKAGIPDSYLLGTMHVTDPRVLAMPAGAEAARQQASTVVLESDEILDEKKAMAGIFANPELTMFTDGNSIDKLLSKPDLDLLEAGLKQRGIPLSAVSRMKPWMLMSFVSLPACELSRKADKTAFLDQRIALDSAAEGKSVKGLETFSEQLSTLAAIPLDVHLKSLIETIKLGSRMNDVFETMTELYLTGNVGLTIPLLKTVAPDGADDAGYGAFEELVVRQRNHRMAERAAAILSEGNAFIAVGALHLPDREGLVELIRQQGYTVTAVD